MTENEKLEMLQCMTDEEDTNILRTYLRLAQGVIISKAYPFGDGTEEMPKKYESLQVEIASAMYVRRGSEGEKSHSENGVSITYGSETVPAELLKRITPMVKVI